jgi:hypothetical protein
MKKIALLSLLVVTTAGCGQGWLPFRSSRGAPCQGSPGCLGAAPAMPGPGCHCEGTSAGYPGYDGPMMGGEVVGGSYLGGEVIHDGVISSPNDFQSRGPNVAPPMGSIRAN